MVDDSLSIDKILDSISTTTTYICAYVFVIYNVIYYIKNKLYIAIIQQSTTGQRGKGGKKGTGRKRERGYKKERVKGVERERKGEGRAQKNWISNLPP